MTLSFGIFSHKDIYWPTAGRCLMPKCNHKKVRDSIYWEVQYVWFGKLVYETSTIRGFTQKCNATVQLHACITVRGGKRPRVFCCRLIWVVPPLLSRQLRQRQWQSPSLSRSLSTLYVTDTCSKIRGGGRGLVRVEPNMRQQENLVFFIFIVPCEPTKERHVFASLWNRMLNVFKLKNISEPTLPPIPLHWGSLTLLWRLLGLKLQPWPCVHWDFLNVTGLMPAWTLGRVVP